MRGRGFAPAGASSFFPTAGKRNQKAPFKGDTSGKVSPLKIPPQRPEGPAGPSGHPGEGARPTPPGAGGAAQSTRSSPQKNRATVPGPVWLPMVVPMLLIKTLPFSFGNLCSTLSATARASASQADMLMKHLPE